jgi:hypothetical protein
MTGYIRFGGSEGKGAKVIDFDEIARKKKADNERVLHEAASRENRSAEFQIDLPKFAATIFDAISAEVARFNLRFHTEGERITISPYTDSTIAKFQRCLTGGGLEIQLQNDPGPSGTLVATAYGITADGRLDETRFTYAIARSGSGVFFLKKHGRDIATSEAVNAMMLSFFTYAE